MPTLQELRSQIAELEKQATELHERESLAAIETVKELVERYGLTAEQVGLGVAPRIAAKRGASPRATTKSSRPGAGVPRFADPATGKTWTGFGKPPAWIAGAKDRDVFRIGSTAPSTPAKSATRKTAGRRSKAA